MDYSFNLEWNELPEELREAKISEYIECSDEGKDVDDEEVRSEAESQISARFPIYF